MLQVADAIARARQEGSMDPNHLLDMLVDDYNLPRERAVEILRKEGLLGDVHAGAYRYSDRRPSSGVSSAA